MTNINCSENCIYQQDGKCFLENIKKQNVNLNYSCAYFTESNYSLSNTNQGTKH